MVHTNWLTIITIALLAVGQSQSAPQETGNDGESDVRLSSVIQMTKDMVNDAVEGAKFGLENFNTWTGMAGHLKELFDDKYGPKWNCIVGRVFGANIEYQSYMFYQVKGVTFILFKSPVVAAATAADS